MYSDYCWLVIAPTRRRWRQACDDVIEMVVDFRVVVVVVVAIRYDTTSLMWRLDDEGNETETETQVTALWACSGFTAAATA